MFQKYQIGKISYDANRILLPEKWYGKSVLLPYHFRKWYGKCRTTRIGGYANDLDWQVLRAPQYVNPALNKN